MDKLQNEESLASSEQTTEPKPNRRTSESSTSTSRIKEMTPEWYEAHKGTGDIIIGGVRPPKGQHWATDEELGLRKK